MSLAAALLLTFVLPALAGGLLLSGPRAGDAPIGAETDRRWAAAADLTLAKALACGFSTWLLGSGILTRTVGLTAASSWIWGGVVGVASLVVLALPRHRNRLGQVLGAAGRRLAEVAGLTALVYLPIAFVVLSTSWSPIGSTPWYYYGLARQVAEAGSIPASSVEFATSTPFLNDYHLFTTSTAMLLLQSSSGPVAVLTMITLLGVLTFGIGSVALTSAFGAGRLASLLALPLAVGAGIGPIRLTAYRPEGFGIGLALLIVVLAVDWLRRHDVRSLVAAGLLVATLSQVHGIAALSAGVLTTGAALALTTRDAWKQHLRRAATALVVFAGAVLVTGLAFHEASGTAHAGGLIDQGGLADPTWEFYQAARGREPSMPPTNLGMLRDTLHALYSGSWWWIVPVLVIAVVGLWRRWSEPDSRRVVWFTLWSVLGLTLVSSVFMLGWQGYVPRRTGASRIPLEASLLVPTLLAIGVAAASRTAWTWRSRTVRRPLPVLVALTTVTALISMIAVASYNDGGSVGRHELALWKSLPLRSDDVVLANGYTEGFIPDVTPATGLLDGRAPYTFDALLHRADSLLRGAEDFYSDPSAHWDYLASHHVTWVVVGNPSTYALSTGNTWDVPQDLTALDRCSGLHKVLSDPSITAYRVVDPGPKGCS